MKLVDHVVNCMLDAEADCIYLAGTYEQRYFSDYCTKKTVEAGRPVRYICTASLVPERIFFAVKDELFSSGVNHAVVMPANIFFNFSLQPLLESHRKSGNLCTVVCKRLDKYDKGHDQIYVKIDAATKSKSLDQKPSSTSPKTPATRSATSSRAGYTRSRKTSTRTSPT